MTKAMAPALSQASSGLAPGQVVGGRFEIERAVADDALGALLAARDQKTKKPIALRVLAPGLIATPEAHEILRAEIKVAAATTHRNLAGTYGMGTEKGARFVAGEWVDGQSLTMVVAQRKAEDNPLSLRAAYNVVSHVARALSAVEAKGSCHGALRPDVVWVTQSGRVKVTQLGLARAIVRAAGPAALGPSEQNFLAPEARNGGETNARTDVFGIGGLLYTMLTARSAADEFLAPSLAHPEGVKELDAILLRCLAADPAARFSSAEEVRLALAPICGGEASLDVDIDIDMGSSESPAAAAPAKPAPPQRPPPPRPPPSGANDKPAIGARVSIHEEFRPSMVDGPVAAPVQSALVDLGGLLSKITENDAPRWMVVKDKMDHGPFSGRELVGMVAKGDVLGEHQLLNMDTGERRLVREYPDFVEFVEQYRLKKEDLDEKAAIHESAKTEKASNFGKIAVGGALVLALLGIGGFFLYTRQAAQQRQVADADLAALYETGQIQIEGTAGILPDPPRGSGGRRGGRRRPGGGGAGGSSYEDAMSEVVDIGSAAGSGGEGRLSPSQVVGVMNGRINTLFTCVSGEMRGGRSLGRVRIDMAIAGSGQVIGSSVRAGSGEFQRCIQQRVAAIRFPSFGAPRMGASYTFDASQ